MSFFAVSISSTVESNYFVLMPYFNDNKEFTVTCSILLNRIHKLCLQTFEFKLDYPINISLFILQKAKYSASGKKKNLHWLYRKIGTHFLLDLFPKIAIFKPVVQSFTF